jgi:bifunctional oligoribonuclease and PAP phosphatase NrnA
MQEGTDGRVRVSLRAPGGVDVSEISASLGGGGHRFAVGFTSYRDMPGAMAQLREALAGWEQRMLSSPS